MAQKSIKCESQFYFTFYCFLFICGPFYTFLTLVLKKYKLNVAIKLWSFMIFFPSKSESKIFKRNLNTIKYWKIVKKNSCAAYLFTNIHNHIHHWMWTCVDVTQNHDLLIFLKQLAIISKYRNIISFLTQIKNFILSINYFQIYYVFRKYSIWIKRSVSMLFI